MAWAVNSLNHRVRCLGMRSASLSGAGFGSARSGKAWLGEAWADNSSQRIGNSVLWDAFSIEWLAKPWRALTRCATVRSGMGCKQRGATWKQVVLQWDQPHKRRRPNGWNPLRRLGETPHAGENFDMKDTTQSKLNANAQAYRFKAGDLVEYRDPVSGIFATGRVVTEYCYTRVFGSEGQFLEGRYGYGCNFDGIDRPDGRPTFAYPEFLRLRSDLAAARDDNAFQLMISSVVMAPRRGRRPKSPYPSESKGTTA